MAYQFFSDNLLGKVNEQIPLLKYSKSSCGVDFLLNTADNTEKKGWFDTGKRYKTDFFEFYFFRKASGYLLLLDKQIDLHDDMMLIISPYTLQEWHVEMEKMDYTFLVFQEEFVNKFLQDQFFMCRLLYCYQNDHPTYFDMSQEEMKPFISILDNIKKELHAPVADSYHMIVAYLYQFLLKMNRHYANLFHLPFALPKNNYAYEFKQLLEKNIRTKTHVQDYSAMMGISRISLNRAVRNEFGVSAKHLLKQRLLQEVKNELLFTELSVKEIAFKLNFSEPNHMMRFFKQLTGLSIKEFRNNIYEGIY